jgi:nucleoside-diphosphate-sugar epimerase
VNVFLAGATGDIGRPSIKILVSCGHRVFALTRQTGREHELWAAGAIPVVQDVFDAQGLARILRAIEPEAIIH